MAIWRCRRYSLRVRYAEAPKIGRFQELINWLNSWTETGTRVEWAPRLLEQIRSMRVFLLDMDLPNRQHVNA